MKETIQADLIIFDLDGTLVNSIPDLTDAINHVCTTKQLKPFTEEQVAQFVGGGVTHLIERAFNIDKSQAGFDDYYHTFLKYYESHHSKLSYLYNDVINTLKYFKSKKMAILSNKMQAFTRQIIKDFNIDQYFDLVIGATDELAKKPSPEAIHYILRKLNTLPEKAVLVGDSEPDIVAAKNAGIRSIAVTYGYRSEQQLSVLKPDFVIDTIDELASLVK